MDSYKKLSGYLLAAWQHWEERCHEGQELKAGRGRETFTRVQLFLDVTAAIVTAAIVIAAIVALFYCCHNLFHSLIRFNGGFNEWDDCAEHRVHLQ